MHSGKMIKKALITGNGTQLSLADAIGCDQSLISRYFSGGIEVSLDLLVRMIEYLNIDANDSVKILAQLKQDKYFRGVSKLEARYK